MLISRFILDLQKVSQTAVPQLASSSAGQSSIDFTNSRIMGSLGSSLPPLGTTSVSEEDLFGFTSEGHSIEEGEKDSADIAMVSRA